jgi:prepilin-type N-terminal cleavage/methylation domain-containing protein
MSTRSERGFTLVEVTVAITIIAILAAISIPTFLARESVAQDSSAKQALENAYRSAKASYVSTDAQFPANVVNLVASDQPSLNVVTGTAFSASQVNMTRDSANQISIRRQSSTGTYYALSDTAGRRNQPVRLSGSTLTTYTNLQPNPSIETTASGWSNWLTTATTRNGSESKWGSFSLGLSGSTTSSTAAISPFIPTLNITYSTAFWVRPVTGGSYTATLQDPAMNWTVSKPVTFTGGSWNEVRFIGFTPTAPYAVGQGLVYRIDKAAGTFSGETTYMDGFIIVTGSTVVPFFDGTFPGSTWTGAENTSTSTGFGWDTYLP